METKIKVIDVGKLINVTRIVYVTIQKRYSYGINIAISKNYIGKIVYFCIIGIAHIWEYKHTLHNIHS